MPTIKVVPWSDDQGDYVLINEEDFDPEVHTAFAPGTAPATPEPVVIPDDWAGLHWATRVKLAKSIKGDDADLTADEANEVITNHLLDVTHDDAGGLSHRELNASPEGLGIKIDPADTPADKARKISEAKAA